MLHNMLVTGVTPLGETNELQNWENRPFVGAWPENNVQRPKENTRPLKKKLKRLRTAYTTEQLRDLERTFIKCKYIDSDQRRELAKSLKIDEKCIKVWFQNRRMKEKKESSESSCDSSSEAVASESISPVCPTNEKVQYETPQFDMNPVFHYEPQHWYSNDAIPNSVGLYQYMPMLNAPGNLFYNDNSVYPTQYYPSLGMEYSNGYTNNSISQFSQYPSETYGNWFNELQPDTYYFP